MKAQKDAEIILAGANQIHERCLTAIAVHNKAQDRAAAEQQEREQKYVESGANSLDCLATVLADEIPLSIDVAVEELSSDDQDAQTNSEDEHHVTSSTKRRQAPNKAAILGGRFFFEADVEERTKCDATKKADEIL